MSEPCPRGVKGVPLQRTAKSRLRLSSVPQLPSTVNVLSVDRSHPVRVVESLEETLSSAILADDPVLDEIVHEIDQISNTLKSKGSDAQTLTEALQRAVLCAVKQALVDRELRSLALTDDLTGLYNRRGFLASATHHLRLAKRNDEALLLFFADVNNLKRINDSYGHRQGDLALIRTADALEQTFRDSDILARLSGDEFAALAPEASIENEDAIRRRLEHNLNKSNGDELPYALSISIGVARFDPSRPASLAGLMGQADQAMYEQKRTHKVSSSKR
ncbi:MAG TPA: GGDEF domain-containing protein [Candidatus Dormibacteraeota bacterium]|nr:GGDEF domain-containing protein [Candidatus Dormibacteraeota bacterium]